MVVSVYRCALVLLRVSALSQQRQATRTDDILTHLVALKAQRADQEQQRRIRCLRPRSITLQNHYQIRSFLRRCSKGYSSIYLKEIGIKMIAV